MELLLSSFLLLHLVVGTSAIRLNQELGQLKLPALQLPLDHVPGSLSFSDVLALDSARVKFLNSRLQKNLTAAAVFPGGLTEGAFVSAPLNAGLSLGVGNYYTKIGVGSPATYYPVVVDTGSSLSWIQCQPCLAYCHPQASPFFNPSSSNTYRTLSCEASECSTLKSATLNSPMCTKSDKCVYTATYGDQSFSQGYLSKDTLTFGSEALPGFVYGCGQNNDGLFGKSAGLVGLAKSSISMLSQLSTKYGKAFSYCLPTASGSGGYLSIGTHSTYSPPSFTPLLSDPRDPSLYFVKLTAISLSGRALAVPASDYSIPTIIDSGTTISRMAGPVYTALREAMVGIISPRFKLVEAYSILDSCFAGTAAAIATVVPPVEMRFQGGGALRLAPRNLLLEVEKGTTCLSFAGNSDIRDSIAIIGNQQQQTTQVVFDIANSRVGFAAGGCR
ncbi:cathepsin D [Salvia divinorum]|uniref:Cathepsin D n=1 Tax=Salvia divinorum TaxID=28513 RepID=A0ABD1FZB8_SALDI